MDSARLHTSSALGGIFPYHVSGTSPDSVHGPDHDTLESSMSERNLPPLTQTGDSVSISERARRLHTLSASSRNALIGIATENMPLYNQIRQERESLEPGDPRFLELSDKLRAILTAGDKALSPEKVGFFKQHEGLDAIPLAGTDEPASERHGLRDRMPNASLSKKQRLGATDDSALFAAPLSYSAPESSSDAPLRGTRASSSSPTRLYGSMPSGSSASPTHLHRVA